MSERTSKGCLVAAGIWIILLAILAVAAKFYILPYFDKELKDTTSSDSTYAHEIAVAADSFSGYAILRSEAVASQLRQKGIKLQIENDNADYSARIKALQKRKIQMAVFTIDSFVRAGAELGDYPASIVAVLDETKGADALVAYKTGIPDLPSLNDAQARIVLTPRSPSEFLSRTVIAHFHLPDLPETWWVEANGAADVYAKFLRAGKTEKRAFALWEPYVTKAMAQPGAHLLLDSSKLQGYIVDVLVVERHFLRDHPEQVQAVLEAYFRAAYAVGGKPEALRKLIVEDAQKLGEPSLTEKQAASMITGIQWKNTLDNYACFGLDTTPAAGRQRLEDMIDNIADVLVRTKAIGQNPLAGKAHTIFYAQTLQAMRASKFHPGKALNLIEGLADDPSTTETLQAAPALSALTEQEWAALLPVGQMRVPPITFARGTARIHLGSRRQLESLAKTLDAWPHYYLIVQGNARTDGDRKANLRLAQERAQAAVEILQQTGVPALRMKIRTGAALGANAQAQSVSFVLAQKRY